MGLSAEGDDDVGTGNVSKDPTEEDNYMELYVEKELNQRIEPLEENIELRKEEINKLVKKLSSMDD